MTEVVTFGCRLNIAESETMKRNAEAAGLSDAIIVNTCTVTAEAERQARQTIRKLKRDNPQAKIIVTGCASHVAPEKFTAMPEVAHVLANDWKTREDVFDQLASPPLTPPASGRGIVGLPTPQGELQRAFVEVQNGCDHRCTFCIIPFGRGASRSTPIADVTQRVRDLVVQGFNEIVFTGVDIASYGTDLPDQPRLGRMVRDVLVAVPELKRLRLSSLDPAAMDEDLWKLIADEPRLMPHLHLSLQAGDDMVLKRMKRRHNRADVVALVERARRLRPNIVFGADIIAGFPTETDAMFENTYNLVRDTGITWLHVFPYSARTGTPAAKMPQVRGEIRKERAERLRALGEAASARHYKDVQGKTVPVLVEKNNIGCTPHFAKLKLLGDAPIGAIVDVKVTAEGCLPL